MDRTESTIALPLPEGWDFKESITLLAPDRGANVIASSEPVGPEIDTSRYSEVQGESLKEEFPGYREFAMEPLILIGDREARLRRFEWNPPDSEEISQMQVYYVEEGRGYTVTATATSVDFPRYDLQLAELIGGLTIKRARPTSEPLIRTTLE